MSTVIQGILIVAAMSSLNSGLYSTGRVLRSLGMSKQAPKFTLKMSKSGVPWAGIVMTSGVYVLGGVLNYFAADAFEIALEAASIGVVFTWAHDLHVPDQAAQAERSRCRPGQPVQSTGLAVHLNHRPGLPGPGHRRHGCLGLAELALLPGTRRPSSSS